VTEFSSHRALIATRSVPLILLYDRAGGSMRLFSQQVVPAVRDALASAECGFSTVFEDEDAYVVLDQYRFLLIDDPAAVTRVGPALGNRFVVLDEAGADAHYAKAFERERFETRRGLRQFVAKLETHYGIEEFAGLDWDAAPLMVILEEMMLWKRVD